MYSEIKEILLQHKGKANAITSKEISSILGFPMEDTQSICRSRIKKTEEIYNLPVISCNRGYYIAETDEEMEEYELCMQRRIDAIGERKNAARRKFEEWNQ